VVHHVGGEWIRCPANRIGEYRRKNLVHEIVKRLALILLLASCAWGSAIYNPSAGGGGIPEAPIDGGIYGRQNASWSVVPTGATPNVITSTGDYTVQPNDGTILFNVVGTANCYLPDATTSTGRIITVKLMSVSYDFNDGTGTRVNIQASYGNIDGLSSYGIVTQYDSQTFQSDGTNWNII
jgi:hypothetical protein